MSSIQYYVASSLDGFIAESDDTLAWLIDYQGSYEGGDAQSTEGSYESFYEDVGALVMGSATYEFVLAEIEKGGGWPYMDEPTWVLSSRELPVPDGADVRVVNARVADLHDELMAAAGERNLWVVGGGNVVSQFADEGLLDELIATLVPVVLGEGKPLFDRRLPGGPLELRGVRPFANGMVELRYSVRSQ
ncbi:MAG TPA: dihydrofolate reductase family protein [Thermoleophilaceae bacterium]|nr:dihydrofolate reductase family protein [Thermoleophilaceae bacterium]